MISNFTAFVKRQSIIKKRHKFLKRWYTYVCAGKRLIYLDESGPDLYHLASMTGRLRGKVYGERPLRPRTSFLAARMPEGALTATQIWESTCNTLIFNQWLEDLLCPLIDGSCVVIMDNATFHKSND